MCMRKDKLISLTIVVVIVNMKMPNLDIEASEQLVHVSVTNQLKSAKNWPEYALNHLAQSMSIIVSFCWQS